MQEFLLSFLNSMLSEAGVLAVTLLLAVIYQTKQLNIERANNKELNKEVLNLAVRQTMTMTSVQNVLDKVVEELKNKYVKI